MYLSVSGKMPTGRSLLMFLVLLIGLFLIWLLYFSFSKDIVDDPGLIIDISNDGVILLDTYNGKEQGTLKGVEWRTAFNHDSNIQNLVNEARRDKVMYRVYSDGSIGIWYESADGSQNLNDKLQVYISGIKE